VPSVSFHKPDDEVDAGIDNNGPSGALGTDKPPPSESAIPMSASSSPVPDLPAHSRRYEVLIEAFVRLSFNEEIELTGWIGETTLNAECRIGRRYLDIKGNVAGEEASLKIRRRRMRSMPVTGQVMGQPIEGIITAEDGGIVLEGVAGNEPIKYRLDAKGRATNFGRPLGVTMLYQSFFSEIRGRVDRIPDAAMVALLMPLEIKLRDQQTR